MTEVSVSQERSLGSGASMLQRFFAPIANALKWAEPFDWDDDEP